ncbi:MAG: hypothetical protein HQL45_15575 [Alphaproteobacteria bacterium]|nr:hypothetical protein [Alphaproteobacteria bacterium]
MALRPNPLKKPASPKDEAVVDAFIEGKQDNPSINGSGPAKPVPVIGIKSVPPDLLARFDLCAKKKALSRSAAIKMLMAEWVEEMEKRG